MHLVDGSTTIHQCLHGYSDGHQLLQSSTRLPEKADQLLLTMSDMSGPSMISGFQSYLTGYSVNGTNWYAFAKTWYANEMRRPGCVWTHTLLMESADLARINDLGILSTFFVRPNGNSKQFAYNNPILLDFDLLYPDNYKLPSRQLLLAVMSGLYENPDCPTYLLADNSDEFSDLVVRVWNQQYSKLRRSFLFCSGSLANRKLFGRSFDLQVIPRSVARQTRREVPQGIFIEGASSTVSDIPPWLKVAVDDLINLSNGHLRSFLKAFGADARDGRMGFSQLLGLYDRVCEAINYGQPLCDIIAALSEYYPEPSQGSLLKQVTLGGSQMGPKFLPRFSESELLFALATTKYHEAFDGDMLKVRERAKKFTHNQREKVKKLVIDLLDHEVNPLGQTIISGIAESLTPAEVFELSAQRYQLLFVFIKYNASLLTMPHIWQESNDRQRELFDVVSPELKSGALDIQEVVSSMLEADSDALAEDVIRQHGYVAICAVMDWLDRGDESGLREGWKRAVSYRPEDLIKWLRARKQPRVRTMAVLACLLDPHAAEVIALGTRPWRSLREAGLKEIDHKTLIQVMAFLLALSFNNPDPQAPEVAAEAFQIVHDAAESQRLSYGSWRQLMFQAPSHSWWGEWDKCERLRYALVDHFIRFQWSPEFFLKAIRRDETFAQILRTYSRKSKGGKFLHRVAQEVEHGVFAVNKARRDKLSFFL